MRSEHFAIEEKRDIGIEFLLELMQLVVRGVPRPRLAHGEDDLASFSIDAEKIDDGWVRDTGRFLLLIMIVLLILRHRAE